MRILKLADVRSVHVKKLAVTLAERGHDVTIAYYGATDSTWCDETAGLRGIQLDRNAADNPVLAATRRFLHAHKVIRALVDEVTPEVIHAHNCMTYGIPAGLANRHPYIVSAWGSDLMSPWRSRFYSPLLSMALKRSDGIHATSQALARYAKCFGGREARVIPFGVDLDQFRRFDVAAAFDDACVVVGTVKALEPVYNITGLVQAFDLARRQVPNVPLRLLICGDGSERPNIEALVARLGLTDAVQITGRLDHGQIPGILNQIDIFANLSLREGLGVSVIEACACETPVVVSDTGGLPEIVQHGVTGFLVAPGDTAATADAFAQLVRDPALRRTMSTAARERMQERFDWSNNVDQFERLYRGLINPACE